MMVTCHQNAQTFKLHWTSWSQTPKMATVRRKQPTSRSSGSPVAWFLFLLLGCAFFLAGLLVGHQSSSSSASIKNALTTTTASEEATEKRIQERVQIEVKRLMQVKGDEKGSSSLDTEARFPAAMKSIAAGMAAVDRDEFAKELDTGVPLDRTEKVNSQVLILYNSPDALPDNAFAAKEAQSQTALPQLSVHDALHNCDIVHLALTHPQHPPRRQCTALMGNYESHHLYKFMRIPEGGRLDPDAPLHIVPRGAQTNGRSSHKPPPIDKTKEYWKILTTYLKNLDSSLQDLAPIAAKTAVNNTLIVMVVNLGQSELLLNFLCSARARKIDLKGILVFATDPETRDLVEGMGINVFYDKTNYEDEDGKIALPKDAAKRYADKTFRLIMLAKVFCVQMPMMLGYNVLFQDVDLVWFKNPLEYFANRNDYDIWFQDDGNHAEYYAPYSANTGFYFIRNNERTIHLFNSLLMDGGMIFEAKSHQIPLIALLSEHASLFGLRIKIFSRDGEEFPGGHSFNRRYSFMRDFFAGAVHPIIFHMSWTSNKDNKIKYFQQMGEWFVEQVCVDKKEGISPKACCAAEPLITCHYRDKPSKIPCKDSPPIDQGMRSFW